MEYKLPSLDSLKKIDDEFIQKGMLVNLFINWEELPWGD